MNQITLNPLRNCRKSPYTCGLSLVTLANSVPLRLVALAVSLSLSWAMPAYAGKTSTAGRKSVSAPVNLSAAAVSSSQINLTWQAGSGQSGFIIQRGSSPSGPWSQIANVGSSVTSYSNTGLGSSTTYSYRMCAYNNFGSSTYAGPVGATTMATACTDIIGTSVSPAGTGTASGAGTYNCNSSVTVTASAASGYNFANWTVNGVVVNSSPSYTFTATANQTCVANFTPVPCNDNISTSVSPAGSV